MKLMRILMLGIITASAITTITAAPTHAKQEPIVQLTVIFDLGGVLIDPDWKQSCLILGPHLLATYVIQHRQSPRNLLPKFYQLMRLADPTNSCCIIKDPFGNQLPSIM